MPFTPPSNWLSTLLPFHLVVDPAGRVIQSGERLGTLLADPQAGWALLDEFEIERPSQFKDATDNIDWLSLEANRVWLLKHRGSPLRLKGAWRVHDDKAVLVANIWLHDLEELSALKLRITDLPVHDTAGDHLTLLHQQNSALADMRELSSNLRDARDAAEDASRTKSEFLASMSHEIRTPMHAVLGLLDALSQTALNDDQQELVDVIGSSAEHLLQVINDILDFSKLEADKMALRPEAASIKRLLQELVAMHSPSATRKRIQLSLETGPDIPDWLLLDALRLNQIVGNLLSNAIKFTPEGGRVDVRLSSLDPWVQIDVADTGPGIPTEQQAHIFQPFVQAEQGIRRGSSGTGLGLSISRQMAHLMEGELSLDSRPGQGSTFSFRFPPEPCAAPTASETHAELDLSGHVLVVDDNPVNLKVAERLLCNLGLSVESASNGAAALTQFMTAPESFDLVLMDCHMPVLDGIEASRKIRELDDRIPIVGLTADVLEETRIACLDAGMNDLLSKPVKQRKLGQMLANYLTSAPRTRLGTA